MKNLRILFALFIISICGYSALAQMKYKGTVVEVLDGKTVVIEIGVRSRLTAELQFIEVPEAEQELHQTVKDHLRKLLLGKKVEFFANQLLPVKTIGQVYADGVDVSQQMLRDGAAWFAVAANQEKEAAAYSAEYKTIEAQAKQEKRGVWSMPNLKPAWEFRQEKAALKQKQIDEENKQKALAAAAAAAEEEKNAVKIKNASSTQTDPKNAARFASQKMGVEVYDENLYGKDSKLIFKYDAKTNFGYVSTPMMYGTVSDGKTGYDIVVTVGYKYTEMPMPKGGKTLYIAVANLSVNKTFLRDNTVSVFLDKTKKVPLMKPEIKTNEKADSMFFEVSRDSLEKLVASEEAYIMVGRYKKNMDESIMSFVRNILDATK